MLATGRPVKNVPLDSPATGFVTARNAFPNQRVTADTDLYTIVDLSRVWIMADVSESDIPAIAIGNRAHVTLPYAPGARPITAKVSYIQPDVDPTTRTLKVRLEVANPGLRLKPEMYVNVEFQVPVPERLVVPAERDRRHGQSADGLRRSGRRLPRAAAGAGRRAQRRHARPSSRASPRATGSSRPARS